jgi:hypothetical protein
MVLICLEAKHEFDYKKKIQRILIVVCLGDGGASSGQRGEQGTTTCYERCRWIRGDGSSAMAQGI